MAIATLKMLTLDSSDARRDARFWSAVLGWDVASEQDEYAMLTGPGGLALGFGTLEDHEAPGWPNEHGTKQFHLDLAVDDLDEGVAACVGWGRPSRTSSRARRGACCSTRAATPSA